jgi:hypothetical protein
MMRRLSGVVLAVVVAGLVAAVALTPARAGVATFTLQVQMAGAGKGQVFSDAGICKWDGATQSGGCSKQLTTSATSIELNAYPDDGSVLTSWSGCDHVSGATCVIDVPPASDPVTATATFGLPTNKLTVTPPTGGTITGTGINCGGAATDCSEDVAAGTKVTLTATAMEGYKFVKWTDACASETTNVCQVTVNGATTVGATFQPANTALLTVAPPMGGFIESNPAGIDCGVGGSLCSHSFETGTHVHLTFTPTTGYALDHWTGACSDSKTLTCDLVLNDNVNVGVVVKQAGKCECHSLEVTVPKNEFGDAEGIRPGFRLTRFFFSINWKLLCTAGDGKKCGGEISFKKPAGFKIAGMWRLKKVGNKTVREKIKHPNEPVTCEGACQKNKSTIHRGTFRVNIDSAKSFDQLEGKDFEFKVITTCNGDETTYVFTVAMGANGKIKSVKRSIEV